MDENRMPRRGSSQCLPKRELEWAKQEKEEPYLGFIGRSTKGDTVIDGALRTVYRTRNARRTFLLSVFFANSLRLLLFPSGSCNGPHPMLPEKRRPEVCVCVWLAYSLFFSPPKRFFGDFRSTKTQTAGGSTGGWRPAFYAAFLGPLKTKQREKRARGKNILFFFGSVSLSQGDASHFSLVRSRPIKFGNGSTNRWRRKETPAAGVAPIIE